MAALFGFSFPGEGDKALVFPAAPQAGFEVTGFKLDMKGSGEVVAPYEVKSCICFSMNTQGFLKVGFLLFGFKAYA